MHSARLRCCERSFWHLHHDAGRQVRDAHRGLGLVDVLAAGAGGAVDVDAQVGRVDLHLDRLVHLGVDEDAGERGVAARVGVERRLAHQAVHAVLGAQVAVGVVAGDLEGRVLDARHLAVGLLEDLDAEALLVAVLEVHALAASTAQSCASVPPAPAWMSMKQLFGSSGLENMRRNSSARDLLLQFLHVELRCRAGVASSLFGARQLEQLLRVGECRCRRA